MHERYGLSREIAYDFARIIAVTVAFREDFDCGPSVGILAQHIGKQEAVIKDRLEEMEGMGFVISSEVYDNRIPGSLRATMQGHTFLRLWERYYDPVPVSFS